MGIDFTKKHPYGDGPENEEKFQSLYDVDEETKNKLSKLQKIRKVKIGEFWSDDGEPCFNYTITDQNNEDYSFSVLWIAPQFIPEFKDAADRPDAFKFVKEYIISTISA